MLQKYSEFPNGSWQNRVAQCLAVAACGGFKTERAFKSVLALPNQPSAAYRLSQERMKVGICGLLTSDNYNLASRNPMLFILMRISKLHFFEDGKRKEIGDDDKVLDWEIVTHFRQRVIEYVGGGIRLPEPWRVQRIKPSKKKHAYQSIIEEEAFSKAKQPEVAILANRNSCVTNGFSRVSRRQI
ncbi:hypothetical protein BDR26DRAFT_877653 [Obelidium mucronatum]|nr:hypothetical protein BDR26DRAFT_877653 [Obelidium mucronatum]